MRKLLTITLTSLALAAPVAVVSAPAEAHTTGIHDNCTNLNKKWPHGLGKKGARDRTSGDPVTNFKRSTKLYRRANNHNSTLDGDNDGVACEKH